MYVDIRSLIYPSIASPFYSFSLSVARPPSARRPVAMEADVSDRMRVGVLLSGQGPTVAYPCVRRPVITAGCAWHPTLVSVRRSIRISIALYPLASKDSSPRMSRDGLHRKSTTSFPASCCITPPTRRARWPSGAMPPTSSSVSNSR